MNQATDGGRERRNQHTQKPDDHEDQDDGFKRVASHGITSKHWDSLSIYPRTAPPFTRIICPVMNDAAGDTSQRAAFATSSGVPQRSSGVSRRTRSCQLAEACSPQAVLIQPGARQFT